VKKQINQETEDIEETKKPKYQETNSLEDADKPMN
jgi:hypothetical protein